MLFQVLRFTTFCLAAGGLDLDLQQLLRLHGEAISAIHSLKCAIEIDGEPGGKLNGSYARSGSDIRVVCDGRGLRHEVVVKGLVVTFVSHVVGRSDGSRTAGGTKPDDGTEYSRCDYWSRCLLSHKLINVNKNVPLEELVREAVSVSDPVPYTLNGKPHLVIELDTSRPAQFTYKCKVKLYFDPSVNYLVRRAEYDSTSDTGKTTKRIVDVERFHEARPSVFCPVEVSRHMVVNSGQPEPVVSVRVSNVVVNEPVPTDIFRVALPNGILFRNMTEGTVYRVDSAGRPTSKPQVDTTDTRHIREGGKPTARAEGAEGGDRRMWPWAAATVALIGAGAGAFYARNRRRLGGNR